MKLHLAELSRRGVFKTLAAYAVTAWVLTEVISVIGEGFLLPPWTVAAATTVLVLGAFPVILLSWRYDVTLEGIKRDTRSLPADVEKSARVISGLIVVVLLAITAALWTNYYRAQSASEADDLFLAQQGAPEIGADGQVRSIAVLPFDDYSPDGGRGLLADGITEAILHVLAQDRNLVVTSRKSSFMFRDKDVSASEIGRILNVQTLLEGSIQIINDQLRVTSQLIRTSDQAHIWSNVYEAPLDDLFKLNEEIATEVRQLILPESQADSPLHGQAHPPAIEAFQLLLEARELIGGLESTERAIRLISVIIELWPDYADAHAWLAMAYNEKSEALQDTHSVSFSETTRLRKEALRVAEIAVDLDPANHLAILFIGRATTGITVQRYHEAISTVMDLAPNDSQVLNWLAGLTFYVGDFEKAEGLLARARAVDPVSNDILISYLFSICGDAPAIPIVEAQVQDYPTSRIRALLMQSLAQFCDRQIAESVRTHIFRSRIDDDPISAFNTLMFLAALGHEEALSFVDNALRLLPADFNGEFNELFHPEYFTGILPEYLDTYSRYMNSDLAGRSVMTYVRTLIMAGDYSNAEKRLDNTKSWWDTFYASEGGRFWQSQTLAIYAYKAWFLAQRGDAGESLAIAEELLQDLESKGIDQWTGSRGRLDDLPLMILLLNGRQQEAVEWLLEAERDQWLFFQVVKTSPVYAELREKPEVAEALARMTANRKGILDELINEDLPEVKDPYLLIETIESLARPTHFDLAQMAQHFDDDTAAAMQHYAMALERDPRNPEIIRQLADLALDHGLVDKAVQLGEHAVRVRPQNSSPHYFLAYYYACAQRWDDAIASAGKAVQLSPEIPFTHRMLGMTLILNGEAQAAMEVMQQIPEENSRNMGLTIAHCALGEKEPSDAIFAQWMAFGGEQTPLHLAYSLAYCDKPDLAFEWLYKAALRPSLVSNAAVHPFLTKLHGDPRWLPFLESIGKSPQQLVGIDLEFELPDQSALVNRSPTDQ